MWPVLTLTLLLQLTEEEQLFAQQPVVAPAPIPEQQMVMPLEPENAIHLDLVG